MKDFLDGSVRILSSSNLKRVLIRARTRSPRGMYIIDLITSRFLPQGGTWDVTNIQWNLRPTRASYSPLLKNCIYSSAAVYTNNLKLRLILTHGYELQTWDLRDPRKPVFSAFYFKFRVRQVEQT